MLLEVEEAVSNGDDWVNKRDTRAIHSGRISLDTVLFSVQEDHDGEDYENFGGKSVEWDGLEFVPELYILELELHRPLV